MYGFVSCIPALLKVKQLKHVGNIYPKLRVFLCVSFLECHLNVTCQASTVTAWDKLSIIQKMKEQGMGNGVIGDGNAEKIIQEGAMEHKICEIGLY